MRPHASSALQNAPAGCNWQRVQVLIMRVYDDSVSLTTPSFHTFPSHRPPANRADLPSPLPSVAPATPAATCPRRRRSHASCTSPAAPVGRGKSVLVQRCVLDSNTE
ncbi:hypothetical protein Vretifemale_11253 [Volvox reticuliferus]|nr:hypothetical protein Vretifemale_11253 [Volvox reticuliferus]